MTDIARTKPHVTIDTEADAAYIYLVGKRKPGSTRTVEATKSIYLDLDADGRLVGIELLDLKLLHPAIGPVLDITRGPPAPPVADDAREG